MRVRTENASNRACAGNTSSSADAARRSRSASAAAWWGCSGKAAAIRTFVSIAVRVTPKVLPGRAPGGLAPRELSRWQLQSLLRSWAATRARARRRGIVLVAQGELAAWPARPPRVRLGSERLPPFLASDRLLRGSSLGSPLSRQRRWWSSCHVLCHNFCHSGCQPTSHG